MRLKILLTTLVMSAYCLCVQAQKTQLIAASMQSQEIVKMSINVFSKSKKTVLNDAEISTVRIILFDGISSSQYSKPFMSDGEITSYSKHGPYLNELFNGGRYKDFIKSVSQTSKFKKGEGKSTSFEIEVYILKVRKDLEANCIVNKLGY